MTPKSTGKKIRGVIFRRGTWWCRWYENGRQRWEACDTKTQAVIRYGKHRADVREKKFFPEKFTQKDVTLSAWMARVVEGSANIGKGNERRYSKRWGKWFGKRLLKELTTEDLRHHQAKMRLNMKVNAETKHPQRRWSDATINRHFAFLRRAFTLAIKDGKLGRNPVSGIKFFPEQHRTRFLSEHELVSLRNVLSPEAWSWVCLAVETGMRQSEQFSLQWKHVDFENSVATIPMSKSGKTRHVSLSDGAKSLLRRFESFTCSPYVFPSVLSPLKPLCLDSFLRNIYRPALKKAGIVGSCWHSLRHTAASRRVMAGVDLLAVKELLGHQDLDTTLKYSHLSPKHLRESVNLGSLGGLLHPAAETVAKIVATVEVAAAGSVQPVDLLVRPEGLEPPTPRSVVWCSIH